MLETLREFGQILLLLVGGGLMVGALAHALAWLVGRRRTARLVWEAWNVLGAVLLAAGAAAIGYAWWGLGIQTGAGSLLAGVGLLLASAGLWMLVPV